MRMEIFLSNLALIKLYPVVFAFTRKIAFKLELHSVIFVNSDELYIHIYIYMYIFCICTLIDIIYGLKLWVCW